MTERPSFGINTATGAGTESVQDDQEPLPLESLFGNEEPVATSPAASASDLFKRPRNSGIGSVEVIREEKKPSLINRLNNRKGSSAALDFKARLKNRYASFKKSLDTAESKVEKRENIGRGTVTAFGGRATTNGPQSTFSSRSGERTTSSRKERQRQFSHDYDEEEVEIVKPSRQFGRTSTTSGRSSSRGGYTSRYRNSSYRNRQHQKKKQEVRHGKQRA